jgi:hypothetical protein
MANDLLIILILILEEHDSAHDEPLSSKLLKFVSIVAHDQVSSFTESLDRLKCGAAVCSLYLHSNVKLLAPLITFRSLFFAFIHP